MSLGILNNISAIYAENYLNQTQASLQTVLQQLSSGSRINSGADDAAGLAVVNGLQANEAALTQSAQNATNGVGLLQTADGALSQVTNLLNRAVTLATEAANSTLSTAQVSSSNQEYQNILTEINDIGSTTNFSGNAVFTNTLTNLFVSDGSATGANSYADQVGLLSTTTIGETASTAPIANSAVTVGNGSTSTLPTQGTGTITATAAGDLLSGSIVVALGSGTADTFSVSGQTLASVVQSFNNDTQFSSQGLTAALGTGGSANVITISGPANGVGGEVTFTNNQLTSKLAGVTDGAPVPLDATNAVDGRSLDTVTLGSANNTLAGNLTLGLTVGGPFTTLTVAAGTTGSELATQINANATFQADGITASYSGSALSLYGPALAGGAGTIYTTGTSLTQSTVQTPGAGEDLAASSVNTLTSSAAAAILTSVTSAIQDVAYQRGVIGADINQLTAASNVASTESVNLTSASNAIQATDYGAATSNLAKYEVLSQTGISALAQSNTVQQEILKLLQ